MTVNSPPAAPWVALLPAALAGTARHSQPLPALPGLPAPDPADAAAQPRQLLRTAAALAVVERAGFQAPAWPTNPPATPAPADDWPALGPAGAAMLQQGKRLLLMALEELDRGHRRLPRPLLPWALAQVAVQELPAEYFHAPALVGSHGPWLSRHRAARAAPPSPPDPYLTWVQRHDYERSRLLEGLMRTDPACGCQLAARALADPAHPAGQKLWELIGLESYQRQTPLPALLLAPLEACRAQPELARRATELLAATEGNELLPRLWALVQNWLVPAPGPTGPALRLALPPGAAWRAEWQTLGLQPTASYTPARHPPAVELAGPAAWLYQALLLVPPTYWARAWGVSMPEAVALAAATPDMEWLLLAWRDAAWLHRERLVARPLLDCLAAQGRPHLGAFLDHLLSPDELAAWMLGWIPGHVATRRPSPEWLWETTTSFILKECPLVVVEAMAAVLRQHFDQATTADELAGAHYELEQFFYTWARSVRDPAALPTLAALLPLAARGSRSHLKYHLDTITARVQFLATLAEPPEPTA